jgi:hypothetical protein
VSQINVPQLPVSEGCATVGAWSSARLCPRLRHRPAPSSRSTRWSGPAATGCSPRPPAPPALTAPPSSWSWTSCAPGDTLVVWNLDRLGRSLRHLVDTITSLADRGVGFRSLQEQVDTTTPGGKLVFHVFAARAEFERNLIRERTSAGLATAWARGHHGGRPPVLSGHKRQVAHEMYRSGQYTVAAIAKTLGVSRASVYRHLNEVGS